MKLFRVKVSCDMIFEMADDHLATTLIKEIESLGQRERRDGRYPRCVEHLHEGAIDIAAGALNEALFRAITAQRKEDGRLRGRSARVLDARNRAVKTSFESVNRYAPGQYGASTGRIEITEMSDIWEEKQ